MNKAKCTANFRKWVAHSLWKGVSNIEEWKGLVKTGSRSYSKSWMPGLCGHCSIEMDKSLDAIIKLSEVSKDI